MEIIPPQGPTIPSSTNFLTNFTNTLRITESISANSFDIPNPPNSPIILSNGILSGLNNPVEDSQAATYAYAQAHGGDSNPGGPIGSIQYNNNGSFGGSSAFTFNQTTNTLTSTNISNGSLTVGSSTITGLTTPNTDQQAATKNYVDNSSTLNIFTINTTGPIAYTPANVINSIIYRNTQTSGTTQDVFPTAAQIVAATDATVGTVINFGIKNTSTNYENIVTFLPSVGITLQAPQNIFAGYQFNAIMYVTNATSGSEAITIYTTSNWITNTVNWYTKYGGGMGLAKVVNITDFMTVANTPFDFTATYNAGNPLATSFVADKVIYMGINTPATIVMDSSYKFAGFLSNQGGIGVPFISGNGGMDFYIINTSTTSGANITLTIPPNANDPLWVSDPNSNLIIPPGNTGWFAVSVTMSNFPVYASLTAVRLYCLGIFSTA